MRKLSWSFFPRNGVLLKEHHTTGSALLTCSLGDYVMTRGGSTGNRFALLRDHSIPEVLVRTAMSVHQVPTSCRVHAVKGRPRRHRRHATLVRQANRELLGGQWCALPVRALSDHKQTHRSQQQQSTLHKVHGVQLEPGSVRTH